jgi:hypothetical protein
MDARPILSLIAINLSLTVAASRARRIFVGSFVVHSLLSRAPVIRLYTPRAVPARDAQFRSTFARIRSGIERIRDPQSR